MQIDIVDDEIFQAYNDREGLAVTELLRDRLEPIKEHLADSTTAFWHPLGFFRLALGSDATGLRYFLHCWPRGFRSTQQPAWLIHRHVWDLESMIVLGSLVDITYRTVSHAGESSGPLYNAHVTEGRSELRITDHLLELVRVNRCDQQAGSFYRVDIGHFHMTEVHPAESCYTLARVGPRLRPNSQVLGSPGHARTLTYDRIPVQRQVLRSALDAVIRS